MEKSIAINNGGRKTLFCVAFEWCPGQDSNLRRIDCEPIGVADETHARLIEIHNPVSGHVFGHVRSPFADEINTVPRDLPAGRFGFARALIFPRLIHFLPGRQIDSRVPLLQVR